MQTDTSDEELGVAFERKLRGPRVLLCNAPRHLEGLKRLNDWQIYCLAAALSVTDAVIKVWGTTFDRLPRPLRESLVHDEILNYDFQHTYKGKYEMKLTDPKYWSDLMRKYLNLETDA